MMMVYVNLFNAVTPVYEVYPRYTIVGVGTNWNNLAQQPFLKLLFNDAELFAEVFAELSGRR